jgi:hypothetical protein
MVTSGFRTDVLSALQAASQVASGDGFAAADTSGIADATAIFATARSAQPTPYVKPGSFSVTALPGLGSGFWGPGKIKINGQRFFTPIQPTERSLYLGARSALAPEIGAGAPLIVIGDSISHWAGASAADKHYTTLVQRFLNYGATIGDEPLMTALRPSSTYTPAFYGVTATGAVSTGTNGPLNESAVLAAGAQIAFTGSYGQVDVYYTQAPGAGTLAFAYNGQAAYKSVNAASAVTVLDAFSGPSPTGQTTSGTYTLTAVGGPVEITGLMRLGLVVASGPPRAHVFRAAHGSYTIRSFGAAAVTSILKQAAALSATPPRVLIALGTNDQGQRTGPQIAADLTAAGTGLLSLLKAGGVTRLHAMVPWRAAAGALPFAAGCSWDGALGALTDAYGAAGVDVLPVHLTDFAGLGLLTDGVHPSDVGHDQIAHLIVSHLAGVR